MSNSSAASVTPLLIEPGPSRRVRLAAAMALLLALLAIMALPLPLPLLIPCELLLLANAARTWQRHHALNGNRVAVRLDSSGEWYWQEHGKETPVALLDDSFLSPLLTILNFKTEERWAPVRSLLLTGDNIDRELFRRLRVRLKEM